MKILQSRSFANRIKKFSKQEKEDLDVHIRKIVKNPSLGSEKRGNLRGIYVYKFNRENTQYLLSYQYSDECLELIMIGSHENYYRDLGKYLKTKQ